MKYKYNNQWKDLTVKAGDTLPIGTIVDYDGTAIPTGYEEVEETEDYSTSETNTGKKWIDGKPIYRKVISIPSFSANTITVDTGLTTIEEIVNFGGSYSRTGYTRRYSIDNTYMAEWDINLTTGVIDLATANQYVTFNGYIILEYTKTTD